MPTEILLYHLTRLNHVAASCVGCGMCESACPRELPLTTIFQAVGEGVQQALNYVPGRSLEEEIPLASFREEGA
jgi:formate dehydrogenase subunit beta